MRAPIAGGRARVLDPGGSVMNVWISLAALLVVLALAIPLAFVGAALVGCCLATLGSFKIVDTRALDDREDICDEPIGAGARLSS